MTVVREGSLRKAADRLGISQVVVSEHVRALEDRLGEQLLDRRAGGPATVNEAGRRAEAGANIILSSVGDLIEEFGGSIRQREITVAVHPFIFRNCHEPVAKLKERWPELRLKFDFDNHTPEQLLSMINQREIDMAVFFALEESDAPRSEFAYEEPLGVFVSPKHPLAQRSLVRGQDLREFPIIHLSKIRALRPLIDRVLKRIGAGGSEVAMETDEFGLILSSVARGQGYVCMFSATESEGDQASGLQMVEIQTPVPALQVRIAYRPMALNDPILSSLRDIFNWRRPDE